MIEAVFERPAVKHEPVRQAGQDLPAANDLRVQHVDLIITEIAAGWVAYDRFVGMHFCLPAQLMKLVEMSPGLLTSEETSTRRRDLQGARMRAEAGEDTGQAGLRPEFPPGPLQQRRDPAGGAGRGEPADIDRAIKTGTRLPMGPLELIDLVGLDTQFRLCEAFYPIRWILVRLLRPCYGAWWRQDCWAANPVTASTPMPVTQCSERDAMRYSVQQIR